MTHSYQIDGMHCNGCIAKVRNELQKLADIGEAEIQLQTPQAIISMTHHVPVIALQQAIEKAGKFTIMEIGLNDHLKKRENIETRGWLSVYKPLLIVFAFITGISSLTAWSPQGIQIMQWMNNFMAGFFITFSFFKLLDLRGFADSYRTYDLLAKKVYNYGVIYAFIELGLGISYLTGWQPFYTNMATVLLMGFSSIGVIKALLNKRKIRCACLGAVFNLPMSTVTLLEDLLMVIMALFSLFLAV